MKKCLPVIIWNKKHSSKQDVPITYTFGKKFFAAVYFRRFAFLEKRRLNKYYLRSKFSFSLIDTYFDVPKSKFLLKNSSLKSFCGGHKNTLRL